MVKICRHSIWLILSVITMSCYGETEGIITIDLAENVQAPYTFTLNGPGHNNTVFITSNNPFNINVNQLNLPFKGNWSVQYLYIAMYVTTFLYLLGNSWFFYTKIP